ncbi:MAG TPA: DnaJ domain-containing protein [Bacteroidales bacterium]|nr:DnaJ domain-containing protein [Bacteroidales bacterium]HOU30050.1 DnaJ domain-containing protein [Bacteroidales bacterium]
MKDYYKILGLSRNATPEEIRQRFRELALENHPDVSENKNASEVFIEIYEAYHILSQPEKKIKYDLLYDKYFRRERVEIPDEEYIKNDIHNVSSSAKERAQQKAKVRYSDFIKDMDCFFIPGLKADGKPYSFSMHKNVGISGGVGPMGSIKSKVINIPIPRSKKAHVLHQIGFSIKVLFFVLAIIAFKLDLLSNYNLVTKLVISTFIIIIGGLITFIFYRLYKVKSKFFFSGKYPLVRKYKLNGYKRGFHPMISTTPVGLIAYLLRLIF